VLPGIAVPTSFRCFAANPAVAQGGRQATEQGVGSG
jgi:hypothetical protein